MNTWNKGLLTKSWPGQFIWHQKEWSKKTSLQKSTIGKTVRAGLHALPIGVSKWRLQSLAILLSKLHTSMLLVHQCIPFATLVNSNRSTMEPILVWPGVHTPPDPAEHFLDPRGHLCVISWGLSLVWSCCLVWGAQLLGFETAHEVAHWELCLSQSGSRHRPSALQCARSALTIHPTREECLIGYSALFPCLICNTRAPVGLCVIITNISSLGAAVLKGTLLKSILADGPGHVIFTVYIFSLHIEYSTCHSARSCPDDVTSQVCKRCKGVSHDVRTWVRGSKPNLLAKRDP